MAYLFLDEELSAVLNLIGPDIASLNGYIRSSYSPQALLATVDLATAGPLLSAVAAECSRCCSTMAERHWHSHIEAYLLGTSTLEFGHRYRGLLEAEFEAYKNQRSALESIIFSGEERSVGLNPGTGLSVLDPRYRNAHSVEDSYRNEGWTVLRNDGLSKILTDHQRASLNEFISTFNISASGGLSGGLGRIELVHLDFPLQFVSQDIYLENRYRAGIWGPRFRIGFIVEQLVVLVGKILPLVSRTMEAVLLLCREIDDHAASSLQTGDVRPPSPAVFGVNLSFMHKFLVDHPEIARESMTTAAVVSSIIVPATSASQQSLVESLITTSPQYVSDIRANWRKPAFVWLTVGNVITYETGFFAYASHAWLLPFVELVNILTQSARVHYLDHRRDADGVLMTWRALDEQEMLEHSYFWFDIFCKSQHNMVPVIDEFHRAIDATKKVVSVLYPERPIVFSRIWCIFEIWTAVNRSAELVPAIPDVIFETFAAHAKKLFDRRPDLQKPREYSSFEISEERTRETDVVRTKFYKYLQSALPIDLRRAQATYPEDLRMIMGLIDLSLGVAALNKIVFDAVFDQVWKKMVGKFGYFKFSAHQSRACFGGDGLVLLADGVQSRRVQDIIVGDKVTSDEGGVAEVVLVCKYPIDPAVGVEICEIDNLLITPEHPVYNHKSGRWMLPKDLDGVEVRRLHNLDYVYNFELSPGASSVLINGVRVMTLGQEVGFEERSDSLYGWGWRQNPERETFLMEARRQVCVSIS
jgi:hypothetical protein